LPSPSTTAIICFAKNPQSRDAKTRLQSSLDPQLALEFNILACHSVFETLIAVNRSPIIDCFIAGDDINPFIEQLNYLWQGMGSFAERLDQIHNYVTRKYDRVIYIGTDSPQITEEDLYSAVEQLHGDSDHILGPTFDGGFYLFGTAQPLAKGFWRGLPFGTERMAEETIGKLANHCNLLDRKIDIDYADDLKQLFVELTSLESLNYYQRELYDWLQQSRIITRQPESLSQKIAE